MVNVGVARRHARGALLGLACGDAVGTTVEFQAPGTFEPITDMLGGGPFRLAAGAWTDDTSMALCLGESILETGTLDLADNLAQYVRWYRHGRWSSTGRCFDIGGTTRAQIQRFERTGVAVDPEVDQDAAANGSLMRLAPVPIAWWRDVDEAAARSGDSSRSTHAADRPVDACRLMGAAVAGLIGGASWDEVTDPGFWRWGPLHAEVEAIRQGSFRYRQPPDIQGSGYCIAGLEAAFWAVDGAESLEEAILRAVNLGDDADTTGAIAGQLAGARWGDDAIPLVWLHRLVMRAQITSMAGRLFDLDPSGVGD